MFLKGLVPSGSWFLWHKEWWLHAQEFPNNIHWIYYEDLKTRPVQVTQRLAAFLSAETDEQFIQRVIEASSFDAMKAKASVGLQELLF